MEDKTFMMPFNKSIIRRTGEEVEIIDSEIKERGARNEEDWVTYIDSKGIEHIKEHLNVQLDFKPNKDLIELFGKVFDKPSFESIKFPSTENTRLYELTKDLVIHRFMNPEDAYDKAKRIVDLCKEDKNDI